VVVKADGLAAGKGVTVAETHDAALAALDDIFAGDHGRAEVVIEAFLDGEEASFFCLVDGETVLPIGTAQDHKRVGEGDTGPNTGGMGAYSPAPVMTAEVEARALDRIIRPTMAEMARRGTPFRGALFAGLMVKDGEPSLVEYNTRFGDPECQCLMMRLGGQALDLLQACAEGRLAEAQVNWAQDHAICVVMAAEGYPGPYAKGSVIGGVEDLPQDSRRMPFHAGTAREAGRYVAAGGRVLGLTARAGTLAEARDAAYAMVEAVEWPEGFCRRDIGWRAL
jgi:phosphoribosylamine--glycine ligase